MKYEHSSGIQQKEIPAVKLLERDSGTNGPIVAGNQEKTYQSQKEKEKNGQRKIDRNCYQKLQVIREKNGGTLQIQFELVGLEHWQSVCQGLEKKWQAEIKWKSPDQSLDPFGNDTEIFKQAQVSNQTTAVQLQQERKELGEKCFEAEGRKTSKWYTVEHLQ